MKRCALILRSLSETNFLYAVDDAIVTGLACLIAIRVPYSGRFCQSGNVQSCCIQPQSSPHEPSAHSRSLDRLTMFSLLIQTHVPHNLHTSWIVLCHSLGQLM